MVLMSEINKNMYLMFRKYDYFLLLKKIKCLKRCISLKYYFQPKQLLITKTIYLLKTAINNKI